MTAAPSPPRAPRRAWLVWAAGVTAYIVAVLDRTSLGVAATAASERFGIGAAQFSLFAVLQLLVYAAMQVPVGVLLDRFGSRRLLLTGGTVMVLGQLLMAFTTDPAGAITARVMVGFGDAMTFVSVLRLIPSWFPARQVPQLTQLTGLLGQLGQVLSAYPLVALLHGPGWTAAYAGTGVLGIVVMIGVLTLLRDRPPGGEAATPASIEQVRRDLVAAFRNPGTRLGLWSHFTVQYSGVAFAMVWGFPFLTQGLGYSEGEASGLLTLLVVGGMTASPVLGRLTSRYPLRRSNLVLFVAISTVLVWTLLLLWPGTPPLALVILLVLVLSANGPTSMVGFDFARTFNPSARLGSATGIVNVGGFVASLLCILGVGLVLDWRAPDGAYDLSDFTLAMSCQYLLWAVGLAGIMRTRVLARRRLRDEGTRIDPLAVAVRRHWHDRHH